MLTTVVVLHDVDDVEAFVQATLNASGIAFERDERDELVLEGLAIMYRLADQFEPHRPGYSQPGRFSGYAAMFLPRRLTDAWHRLHPEHCYVTRPDGGREWYFAEQPVSLDGLRSDAAARKGSADGVDGQIRSPAHWARPRRAA